MGCCLPSHAGAAGREEYSPINDADTTEGAAALRAGRWSAVSYGKKTWSRGDDGELTRPAAYVHPALWETMAGTAEDEKEWKKAKRRDSTSFQPEGALQDTTEPLGAATDRQRASPDLSEGWTEPDSLAVSLPHSLQPPPGVDDPVDEDATGWQAAAGEQTEPSAALALGAGAAPQPEPEPAPFSAGAPRPTARGAAAIARAAERQRASAAPAPAPPPAAEAPAPAPAPGARLSAEQVRAEEALESAAARKLAKRRRKEQRQRERQQQRERERAREPEPAPERPPPQAPLASASPPAPPPGAPPPAGAPTKGPPSGFLDPDWGTSQVELLPDNWTAHRDPASSSFYYFNEKTLKVSWDRPSWEAADAAPAAVVPTVSSAPNEFASNAALPKVEPAEAETAGQGAQVALEGALAAIAAQEQAASGVVVGPHSRALFMDGELGATDRCASPLPTTGGCLALSFVLLLAGVASRCPRRRAASALGPSSMWARS